MISVSPRGMSRTVSEEKSQQNLGECAVSMLLRLPI